MGQKDFTDWNGRKRHDALYPPREKEIKPKTCPKRDKPVGLKTKVDRYTSELKDLGQYWKWYRNHQRIVREERLKPRHRLREFDPHWSGDIHRQIKKLKSMKAQYKKEGILDRFPEHLFRRCSSTVRTELS